MNNFDPKDPSETLAYYFDFTAMLRAGEVVESAVVTIKHSTGEATPTQEELDDMLVGAVVINAGKVVSQLVTGGELGNVYKLKCVATTDQGQEIVGRGTLPIEYV